MSSSSDPCVTVLPPEQVIGLSFTGLAGFISAFAVIFVLALVARNYMRNVRNPPPGGEWKLIRTHVDAYLLSLLASDFMQSLGAILDIKWAAEKQTYCSATCTAQGTIQVIGETGVAMTTFAIALHTFLVIFFRWSPSQRSSWVWKVGISFIWLYVTIYAIVGYAAHHRSTDDQSTVDAFYTPTPYWCWISNNFLAERITGEYLWLWFAAFSSIILYTFLFFRVRGNITVDPLDWRRVRFKWRRWHAGDDDGDGYFDGSGRGARGGEAGKTAAKEAMSMIWYPLTYTVLVLPLSIVRWSTFRPIGQAEPNVPFALTCVVVTIFSLSGIVNVILILLTRKNLLLFGQRGVINPAKIGPAATGRLPPQRKADGAGGGGGGGGMEKKERFNFRDGLGHNKHGAGGKRDIPEDSTGETSDDQQRRQGDTSFAAGRFTTQAFATERSFDVGSNRAPFSPVTGPTDTNETGPTESMPSGIPMDEEQSYGYGYGYGPGLGAGDSGIPEGMSRDLGSRGEYDLDVERDREREWKSFGSVQQQLQQPSTNNTDGMLKAGIGRGGQTVSSGLETQPDVSQPGSNFLEMKDSRSNPGQPEGSDYPHYPPQPPPPLRPPPQHAPPSPQQQPQPHPYSQSQAHPQQLYAEGRRGSAGTGKSVGGGSRPGSAKSKAGSSIHPGRPSGDVTDYSVPMKFNPTPAPTPTVPPGLTTTTTGTNPFGFDAPDSRSPYGSKSRNGSSKSLGKATSTSTTATTTAKSPWSGFTSMFSKRDSYGVSPPNSAQSDTSLPPPPTTQHHQHHQRPQSHQHSSGSGSGSGSGSARHPPHQLPNHPYQQAGQGQQQDVAQIRPLHSSRDFGPQLRSSLSLRTRTPDAELERSPFDDAARLEGAPSPSHEALALSRTRTGNSSSHDGFSLVAGAGAGVAGAGAGAGANLQGGSWSRASVGGGGGGGGGRRGTLGTQADEEAYHFRPNTAGSNRSYTFGTPGFNTGASAAAGGSSSSLRADAVAAAAAAGNEHGVEMQARPRQVSTQPPLSPLNAQSVGRAL